MSRKLRAPKGTDEANFGTHLYRVDNDGTVDVPDDAVPYLTSVGAFETIDEPSEIPHGSVRMLSTKGPMSVSVAGQSFNTGDDLIVVVPLAFASEMLAHGLVYAPDDLPVVAAKPVAPADPLSALK